jgi:flagellar motor protein MotB
MTGTRVRVRSIPEGTVFTLGGTEGFAPFSAEIGEEGRAELGRLARLLAGRRNVIEIVGHASIKHLPAGSAWTSLDQLSFQRAINVKNALVAEGLDDRVFRIEVAGPRQPIDPRATTAAEAAANRRVEIILTDDVVDDDHFTDATSARGA